MLLCASPLCFSAVLLRCASPLCFSAALLRTTRDVGPLRGCSGDDEIPTDLSSHVARSPIDLSSRRARSPIDLSPLTCVRERRDPPVDLSSQCRSRTRAGSPIDLPSCGEGRARGLLSGPPLGRASSPDNSHPAGTAACVAEDAPGNWARPGLIPALPNRLMSHWALPSSELIARAGSDQLDAGRREARCAG